MHDALAILPDKAGISSSTRSNEERQAFKPW